MFGGTSNHWGGHCLPLDDLDFRRSPLSGLTGWPVSKDDMNPFYERAHSYCDLGSYDYSVETLANVSDADLMLPGNADLTTEVIRQSSPTNFASKYRSAFEASDTVDVWLWTNATGFDFGSGGQLSGLRTATLGGELRTFAAKDFVIACGAVENARLMLQHNADTGDRFGDEGGFLGACYMDHPVGGAAFLWPSTPPPPKAYWIHTEAKDGVDAHLVWRLDDAVLEAENLANAQFFLIPLPTEQRDPRIADANKGWRNLKNIVKWTLGRDISGGQFVLSDAFCNTITNADAMALDAVGAIDRTVPTNRILLRYEAEQQPDQSNRVSLLPDRDALGNLRTSLHWSPSLEDRDSIVRSAIRIGEICGASGIGRIELEDHFDARYWDAATAWHQMGTTRIAESPRHGVVDADLRVHGTRNLFVAGASVFPSGGRANPTLTVVALSLRLADHLKARGKS